VVPSLPLQAHLTRKRSKVRLFSLTIPIELASKNILADLLKQEEDLRLSRESQELGEDSSSSDDDDERELQ
jgi:hypothetical protein